MQTVDQRRAEIEHAATIAAAELRRRGGVSHDDIQLARAVLYALSIAGYRIIKE